MSIKETRKAIHAFFAAQWLAKGQTATVQYEGFFSGSDPAKGSDPWIRISYNESAARQISLGDAPSHPNFRYEGAIFVQCFCKATAGTSPAEALADVVKDIFIRFSINDANAGYIRNQPSRSVLPIRVGIDPRGWYQINVQIPYLRDLEELN
jgi:hypothetical protein